MIIALTDGELQEHQLITAQQEVATLAAQVTGLLFRLDNSHCLTTSFLEVINFTFVFQQAERARSLGAIVYCVGVKDFNETQVMPVQ